MKITKETMVEDVFQVPGVMEYCLMNRVSVFSCAGAYPQSFGRLLENKKIADPDAFLEGLNEFLAEKAKNGAK